MRRAARRAADWLGIVAAWLAILLMFSLLFLGARAQGGQGHHWHMVTMYDAGFGNASKIPASAPIVAGHGFTPALWNRWPKAEHVTIAHSPTDYTTDAVDFEPGGGWVWGIPNLRKWLAGHQRATGNPGLVYVNKSRIWMVRAAAAGLRPPYIWASDQTGSPHMVSAPGVVATQWYGSRQPGWNGVDISEVSVPAALTGGGGGTPVPGPGPRPPPGPEPVPSPPPGRGGLPGLGDFNSSASSAGVAGPVAADQAPADTGTAAQAGGGEWLLLLAAGGVVVLLVVMARRKRGGARGQGQ